MSAQFETLPRDKGYPGRTQYRAPDGRVFVCMGVGEEAERVLLERAAAASQAVSEHTGYKRKAVQS